MSLAWSHEFRLDVAEMDREHEAYFALLLRCAAAEEEAVLGALFSEVVAQTRTHFAEEEQLMRESGYHACGCHIGEHARVLDWLVAVESRKHPREMRICVEKLLPRWLADHILTLDATFAGWMQHRVADGGDSDTRS